MDRGRAVARGEMHQNSVDSGAIWR